MKTKTTAIVASLVIIALASSAIIGATYSWFEDEDKVTTLFSPGKVSIDVGITDLKAKNYEDVNWIEKDNDGIIHLDSGATVSMSTSSTDDATAASITFDKAAPGDSVSFMMEITNKSDIKAKWTVLSDIVCKNGNVVVDGSGIFDISIKYGNPGTEVSGYKEFGTDSVKVTVIISINTDVEEMPASSEITITAKATQLATPSATTNP